MYQLCILFFSPEKTERNKQQVGVKALSWLPSLVVQIWRGSVLESCFLNAEEEPDRPCSTPQSILSFVIMFLPVRQLNWEAVASLSPDISVYLLYVIATKFCSSQYHIFRLLSNDYHPESSLFHSNSIIPVSVAVLQVFVIHNNFSGFLIWASPANLGVGKKSIAWKLEIAGMWRVGSEWASFQVILYIVFTMHNMTCHVYVGPQFNTAFIKYFFSLVVQTAKCCNSWGGSGGGSYVRWWLPWGPNEQHGNDFCKCWDRIIVHWNWAGLSCSDLRGAELHKIVENLKSLWTTCKHLYQ